ncbi:predicted protein [Sclerotinia sclerotiorum 1980 UF-70]|uniref:Uncharacterized protein n=1 Tax=Sclerotinia sclerotiorum (strain ATCC 18683 / 1980 / Ss-1) TaxID=665079 RepID=A7EMQ3_SCLS1|nr:predicted protein [Sclerotinia sclerotiorum 1980 UF-70]EDO04119.1 predicted protein [Sclerotinia sclerotiorum 1980 UF-70]
MWGKLLNFFVDDLWWIFLKFDCPRDVVFASIIQRLLGALFMNACMLYSQVVPALQVKAIVPMFKFWKAFCHHPPFIDIVCAVLTFYGVDSWTNEIH